ncbi:MAG TPA: hypothetical protein VD770_04180 [Coxiellaceae bacterium]|nr:hypothetical protein [Coxiellaceae bacterium]
MYYMKFIVALFAVVLGSFVFINKAEAVNLTGHLDTITSQGVINGWATDKDQPGNHMLIHVYFDGPVGKGKHVTGNSTKFSRCDIKIIANDCGFHYGYEVAIPEILKDGKSHKAYVYVISPDGKKFRQLFGSPKTFSIAQNLNVRHSRGTVVSHEGVVYFLGESVRYPFPSAEVFFSWGHAFDKVVKANNADLAMPVGPVLGLKSEDKIAVVSPNGGEDWKVGEIATISWADNNFDPSKDSYIIHLTAANGGSYGVIAQGLKSQTYQWTVGKFVDSSVVVEPGENFHVQVVKQGSGLYDQSDAAFEIYTPAMERDAYRLITAIAITSYLNDEYFVKHGEFPDSLSLVEDGVWSDLEAPTPADGSCSESDNQYYYEPSPDKKNFIFRFCLGTDYFTKDFTDEGLVLTQGINVWDRAYVENVNESQKSYQSSVRDAKRVAEIKQLMTALEIYYYDYGYYPESLTSLSLYLTTIPTAPVPADGGCSESQNNYVYQKLHGGAEYSLTFCLGSASGGYSAGFRTAASTGIN